MSSLAMRLMNAIAHERSQTMTDHEANYFLINGRKLVCFVVAAETVRIIEQNGGRKTAERTLPRQDARQVYAELRQAGYAPW